MGSQERVADLRVVTHGRVLGPWMGSHVRAWGPDMGSAELSQLLTHLLINIRAIVRDGG
jgi:hypothetical protein